MPKMKTKSAAKKRIWLTGSGKPVADPDTALAQVAASGRLAAIVKDFKPAVILTALPLSFAGAFLGLLIFNLSLSIPSLIGFLMLMGLAAKNGILLVDFANQARREGLALREALIEAGRVRMRPILMTSFAMIFGMLPLALALGEGSETRAPMAHAVIGGMVTSTLLTLIVVPVVYSYLEGMGAWWRARRKGGKAV